MILQHDHLYHKDTKGNLRSWYVEVDGAKYRTVAGLVLGEKVTSEWTTVKGKNIGRSNETSPEVQCLREVVAMYEHKSTRKYARSPDALEEKDIAFPMLAAKYDPEKSIKWSPTGNTIDCFTQPKLDGIRCLARLVDGKVTLWSRQGRQHMGLGHIEAALWPTLSVHKDAILDGELYNHSLRSEFNTILSAVRGGHTDLAAAIEYHVYDCFGGELTPAAFVHRRDWLKDHLLVGTHSPIKLVTTVAVGSKVSLDLQYETFLGQGYEGQMVRQPFAPYEVGKRSKSLLKRKEWNEAEFLVVDILEGTGNWAGKARKAILRTGPETISEADIVGTYEECKAIWDRRLKGELPGEATTTYFGPISDKGGLRFGKVRTFWETERDL